MTAKFFFRILLVIPYLLTANGNSRNALPEEVDVIAADSTNFSSLTFYLPHKNRWVRYWIHFQPFQRLQAKRLQRLAAKDFPRIHDYLGYAPNDDVHFVFSQVNLEANGSATVFPRNQIILNDYPPGATEALASSQDWFRSLVIHEYFHIASLEHVSGWPSVGRKIFGSLFALNALTPRWWIEGTAVWMEKFLTLEGRLTHSLLTRQVAFFLNNPQFCRNLSCLDIPGHFPSGALSYWAGALFVDFLESRYPGIIACVYKKNSASAPFLLSKHTKACTGMDLEDNWLAFRKSSAMTDLNPICPFLKSEQCESFRSIWNDKAWWTSWMQGSGHIATENSLFYLENKGQQGEHLRYRSQYLVKKSASPGGLRGRVHLPFPVEKIYECSMTEKRTFFCLTSWVLRQGVFQRKTSLYSYRTLEKLKSYFIDASFLYFNDEQRPVYALSFQAGRWQVVDNDRGEILWSSDVLPNFYPIKLRKKQKELQLSYFRLSPNKRTQSSRPEVVVLGKVPSPEVGRPTAVEVRYNRWRYIKPNYFLLNYNYFQNLSRLSFQTHIDDPLETFRIEGALDYYWDLPFQESPIVPRIRYRQDWKRWSAEISYDRTYARTGGSNTLLESEREFLSIGRASFWKEWSFFTGPQLSFENQKDFISKRDFFDYGLYHQALWQNDNQKDYLQQFFWDFYLGEQKSRDVKAFSKVQTRFLMNILMSARWNFELSGSYAKFFKEDLVRGVVYGGGASSFFTGQFFFPYYAIPFGNLFGNDMHTLRWQNEWQLSRLYKGQGTWPFYAKEIHFLAGAELIKSEFSFLNETIVEDQALYSVFGGLKLSTQLFYHLPVDFEYISSQIIGQGTPLSHLFLVQAQLATF